MSDQPGRLQDFPFAGTYSAGDSPLTGFYLPALSVAYRYDRMAGYFSSRVFRIAARGIVPFVRNATENGGAMRLIVGTQLLPEDVAAVREGGMSPAEAMSRSVSQLPLGLDGDQVGDLYLRTLSWLVREGLLEVRVGVPLDNDGNPLEPDETISYFHSKYGILTDPTGDQVAFLGSDNETAAGWLYNHETFVVAKSWMRQVWAEQGQHIVERFEKHWNGAPDHGWAIEALLDVDDRLLKLAGHDFVPPVHDPIWKLLGLPKTTGHDDDAPGDEPDDAPEDPTFDVEQAWADLCDLARQPMEVPFTGALTAPAAPLPHQARIIYRAVTSHPRGYLFADPVGFGKTIEMGLTIRELLLSGKARTALLLVPAAVQKQWQEELSEKIGLDVARYDGQHFWGVNGELLPDPGGNPWQAFPVVLGSSHLARRRARRGQLLQAAAQGGWDIVAVDEAHHARRRGSKPTDTPNSLLSLLHALHEAQAWRVLYLATATPMQMNPHEAWDLINLLDLPGRWGHTARNFLDYYRNLGIEPPEREWFFLQHMLADYFSDPQADRDANLEAEVKTALGAVSARKITRLHSQGIPEETAQNLNTTEIRLMDRWLRRHTPMRDRVFRNTRQTLLDYQAAGIIPPEVTIPTREVQDVFIAMTPQERDLYNRIEDYITRYYNAYKASGQQALGFIMTIYRRRLTSSFYAIRCSLERRLDALRNGQALAELLTDDDYPALEADPLFDVEGLDVGIGEMHSEIHELEQFVASLRDIGGDDSKSKQLLSDLQTALYKYASVVVFTQYTDTMDYIRKQLVAAGYSQHARVGCYSGRGGEIWNPDTGTWEPVTKQDIKTMFRDGTIKILIGTDSMSEGLNLQTCGRLIQYEMPWNLMRAEQRNGRVDRIGATYKNILVTNYFYAGTVEESVYRGLAEDYGDFTNIVGSAQPVLADIEKTIEQYAMTRRALAEQPDDIRHAIERLKEEARDAAAAPVKADDLGNADALSIPEAVQDADTPIGDLESGLTTNPITASLFSPTDAKGVWTLRAPDGIAPLSLTDHNPKTRTDILPGSKERRVTFDRRIADKEVVMFLTYGDPVLDRLLPSPTSSD